MIEKNAAPVAATFHFGEAGGVGERVLSTRVRIDMYSNVRAVIETTDAKLHMAAKFVKASDACSAPAGKDMDEALASMGKMQIRTCETRDPGDELARYARSFSHDPPPELRRDADGSADARVHADEDRAGGRG